MTPYQFVAQKLNLKPGRVEKTILLLEEGSTIPFISRYRKELTGSLDEVQIADIQDEWEKYQELEKRKAAVIKAIDEQGKLSEELRERIRSAELLTEVEDLYLPYKVKRKTKAEKARQLGLEPLATLILKQEDGALKGAVQPFLNDEVATVDDALQGARDIIAEVINEDKDAREEIRQLFQERASFTASVVKSKKEEAEKYRDYFDFSQKWDKCPSHRVLAIFRGEDEGYLRVHLKPKSEQAIYQLDRLFLKAKNDASWQVKTAIEDAYKRLLEPSIENEFRKELKTIADEEAIQVFSKNLYQLLLAPPLGAKRILAIDPGYRTGCKVVCLDEQGNLLHNENIYPHKPQSKTGQAAAKISQLVESYRMEAIAIGNGTAGRETEYFVKKIRFDREVQVFVVNENGASVYSASAVAREEFPDYDVTVRGAVSIGRRLMDPLAELVKIEPKSIGVGQYQHDVDQGKLKKSLDLTVESAVNKVGVNLNTASKHLLMYVSGIGEQIAQNMVEYRKENGAFQSREELKRIPRLGDKAFEQCAGFLRIRDASNSLDNTAVHPERYSLVNQMAKDLGVEPDELLNNDALIDKIELTDYVSEELGLPTLEDIISELKKPGRDPREKLKVFEFAKGIHKPEDLEKGMKLPGIVTNITAFGAFVDIGVKQDGLVHLSNMANRFVKDPNEVVTLNQHVEVTVIDIDLERKRIGLSMKE